MENPGWTPIEIPNERRVALIDIDGMVHAAQYNHTVEEAKRILDGMITGALAWIDAEKYHVACKGKGNFRKQLSPEYKYHRNRDSALEGELAQLLTYAEEVWGAVPAHNFEADDLICCWRWYYEHAKGGWTPIMVSNDKDMLTISGWHFNYRKTEYQFVSEADSLYNFANQLIQGDSSDNIPGIPGLGPKKAAEILAGVPPEQLLDVVKQEYQKHYGTRWKEEMQLNADLLYIRPHPDHRFIVT